MKALNTEMKTFFGAVIACLFLCPMLGIAGENTGSSPEAVVRDITPEFGPSGAGSGFTFNREDPRQIILPTPGRIFRSLNGGANWTPSDLWFLAERFSTGSYFIRQDPRNPRVLFTVANGGTASVYRSDNFGAAWTEIPYNFYGNPVDCAVSEASSNVVLVLTDYYYGDPFFENSIEHLWRSEDGGATFAPQLDSGLPKTKHDPDTGEVLALPGFSNIATTPAAPNVVYVVQNSDVYGYYPPSIYKSADGGQTFSRLETFPANPIQVFPHPTQSNVLFVQGGGDKIFRSTDGGASFQLLDGLPPNRRHYFVAFDASNPSLVYIAGQAGFFRSTDGGNTFQPTGLTADQLGFAATTASVDPSNSNILYVNTTGGNFKSFNGGATFVPINNGWKAAQVRHVAFDNDREPSLYLAMSGGILRTRTRGARYEEVPHPSALNNPTFIAVSPLNTQVLFAGTSRGLYRTANGGMNWTPVSIDTGIVPFSGTDSEIVFDPLNPQNVYFVSGAGVFSDTFDFTGFYRSTDSGISFERTFMPPEPCWCTQFTDLAIDPVNPNVIFTSQRSGGNETPLRSVDGGLSFSNGPIPYASVTDIAIDPQNPNNIYLAGFFVLNSGVLESFMLVRSTDGGATYNDVGTGLTPTGSESIKGMVIDPINSARLYIWTNHGLFMSGNHGSTWTLLEGNETVRASWLGSTMVINPKKPNLLYLVGNSGLLEVEIRNLLPAVR